jgi:hypothetical protein
MSAKQSIQEQKEAHKRRLHQLQLQQAKYGMSADPYIVTQIEDLQKAIRSAETIEHSAGLIDIHRQNLTHLLKQRTHFGANVPTYISNQIASERQGIAQQKSACAKYGYNIFDHPVDEDRHEAESPEPAHIPYPIDPIVLIRQELRDIEALLRRKQYDAALSVVIELQEKIR